MHTQVSRWGNSLAVRIPKAMADALGLYEGAEVEMDAKEDLLTLRKQEPTLEEMVSEITPENIHEEFEFGSPVGKEVW